MLATVLALLALNRPEVALPAMTSGVLPLLSDDDADKTPECGPVACVEGIMVYTP